VDNQVQAPPDNSNVVNEKEKDNPKDSTKKEDHVVVNNQEKSFVPKAPFPQRIQQTRKKNHCEGILKVFKNVQINIPFFDAINQIPSFAKFLKDLTAVKRKNSVPRETAFSTQVSCLILQPIAPKYEDPRSPTISVGRGDQVMDWYLLDLGASVNLLPYSVYKQLGLEELQPTKPMQIGLLRSPKELLRMLF